MTIVTDAHELVNITASQEYPVFTNPLMAAKALHMSATYYEEKKARDSRGNYIQSSIDLNAIHNIKNTCQNEKRIPLTDECLVNCRSSGDGLHCRCDCQIDKGRKRL